MTRVVALALGAIGLAVYVALQIHSGRAAVPSVLGAAAIHSLRRPHVAAVTPAFSFASLALIPLAAFREFAFAMPVGILLDTFIVRSFQIPAVVSAVGSGSWWRATSASTQRARRAGRPRR